MRDIKHNAGIKIFRSLIVLITSFLFTCMPLVVFAENFDCDAGKHDYVITTVEATENEDGETTYTCKICGFTFIRVLPATGHIWSEWITDRQPTCIEAGHEYRICTRYANDSHTEENIIPAFGHKYTETVTPPICEKDGFKTYTCEYCGDTYTEPYGEASGHNYIEEVVKEPDCENEGEKVLTCEHCGDAYTIIIPALGHNYGDWIIDKEPTEEEEGRRHKVCGRDSSHVFEETIERLEPAVDTETPEPPELPEPEKPEDTKNNEEAFPGSMDIVLFTIMSVEAVGFGITICRDLYILRWKKRKSISLAEWLRKNQGM